MTGIFSFNKILAIISLAAESFAHNLHDWLPFIQLTIDLGFLNQV